MTDIRTLLAALRMGDSAFPSGGFAFSWGLETLVEDGKVNDGAGVLEFARIQLRNRWATADRVMARRAAETDSDEEWSGLDRMLDAMTLASELRAGSCQAGRALLRAHSGLGNEAALRWRRLVADGRAHGHLPVVQGAVWAGSGMTIEVLETLSAWTLMSGIAQAAIRLSLTGPLQAQAILDEVTDDIACILAAPPPDEPHAFTPLADIAVMRHERGDVRLFAN